MTGWMICVPLGGFVYSVSGLAATTESAKPDEIRSISQFMGRCAALDRLRWNLPESAGDGYDWQFAKALPSANGDVQVTLTRRARSSMLGVCPLNTSLMIICKNRKPEIVVRTGVPGAPPFGPDGGIVFLSLGSGVAKRHYFLGVTDSGIRLGRSKELVRAMLTQDTMKFSYRAFDSSQAVATFDLHGLSAAIEQFKGYCDM